MFLCTDDGSRWGGGASPSQPDPGSHRRAWTQVGASFVGLAGLASQLPDPVAMLATLFEPRHGSSGGGVADVAMLAVAAVAVWVLLVWVVLISTVAVAGRLPGAVGSAARAGLAALAPVAVRNVLLTVVGASVVTGLAGCTTVGSGPGMVPPGQAGAGTVGTSAAASAALASATAGPGAAAAVSGSASQLVAERLIGIATLRISDRIAVEGSAVRSAGVAPVDSGPATPSLDWPATPSQPPVGGLPVAHTRAATPSAPEISIDWPGPAARGGQAADRSVVVLRGDSLWTIAARSLPAGTDDATIDRTWRAWYAANTSVIGSDPDYLLPGQILTPPTPETGTP